jgi:hypothetical protein
VTGSNERRWQPVLEGSLAARAAQAIEEIATALSDPPPSWGATSPVTEPSTKDIGLPWGRAGIALPFHYLGLAAGRRAYHRVAEELLNDAVDAMAELEMEASLYGGFTGIAWVAAHLGWPAEDSGDGEDGDVFSELDGILAGAQGVTLLGGQYDLVSGAVGLGVYGLERLPAQSAAALLDAVTRDLSAQVVQETEGTTWRRRHEWLAAEQRAVCPHGCFDLGIAHGVPGILLLLAAMRARGIQDPLIDEMLDSGTRWLIAQRLPPGKRSAFPSITGGEGKPEPSRLAWCYGDLGISFALLRAAHSLGRPEWREAATELARAAAERPFKSSSVLDTGLCHGAAGVAHLFNRLYQETGNTLLKDAAERWFEQLLDMRQPGRGVAGFSAWLMGVDGTTEYFADPGFLMGAAGVALALTAATSSVQPRWDRVLLLD